MDTRGLNTLKISTANKVVIGISAVTILIAFLAAAVVGNVIMSNRSALVLPAPGGKYLVGRKEFDWVDQNRLDPLANDKGEKRELVVWAWYPAASGEKPVAPYLPVAWASAYGKAQGTGRYFEHDLDKVRTHSFPDVPVAGTDRVYPVIVMEPAMGRMPTDYTVYAEALASHGYVVFGINPTYSANLTVFPDGRIAHRTSKGSMPPNATTEELRRDAERIGAVWQQDVEFVMNRLDALDTDQGGMFHGRLDLTRIGLFGHSFGGGTAFEVCARDARCKAGVDIDGRLWSGIHRHVMQRPFLFIAEEGCGHHCESMREKYLTARASTWYLTIKGARHFNFCDLPLRLSPIVRSLFGGYIGDIAPERGLEISNAGLVSFFDETLKGGKAKALSTALAAYPEVRLRTRWQHPELGRFLQSSSGP